jgi:hypothetical protein
MMHPAIVSYTIIMLCSIAAHFPHANALPLRFSNPTRRCSRPLRARDRSHFGRHSHALAAAKRQHVGPPSIKVASLLTIHTCYT